MPISLLPKRIRRLTAVGLVCAAIICPGFLVHAAWDGQYYEQGETLNPECAPTDTNCDVNPVTDAAHGGTGLTSYTAGDLLYASSSSTIGRLGLGIDGKILKVVGGQLAWADETTGTAFTADGNGIELSSSTFSLELDGASLTKSADGLRLSATYAGQNTITTLGTIATGVWNGTAIGDAYLTKSGDWTGTLDGTEGAAFLARANHTGTQAASTISDFSAAVAALLSTGNGLVVNGTAFGLVLDGASLTKSIDGLRLSATYAGQNTITTLGTIASGVWNGTAIGDSFLTKSGDWTGTLDGLEGAGMALVGGRAGGQTISGGTASGENLTLQSTGNATKGKIIFGTSAYDETNNRLGIGTASPAVALHISRTDTTGLDVNAPQILADNPATTIGGSSVFRARTGTGYSTYPEIWMEAQTGVNGVVRLRGVSNHSMEIRTADVTRLRIDSTGYSIFPTTPTASANYGAVNIGAVTAFDGSTSGKFVGSASGTQLAINAASGYVGALIDAQVAGASKFLVSNTGRVDAASFVSASDITAGSNNAIQWSLKTQLSAPTAGTLLISGLSGGAGNEIIKLGGTTSSFPAIKRSGTGIEVRLADDSGYAPLTSSTMLTSSLITSNGGFLASSGNTAFTSTGTSTIASGSFASFNNPKSFAPTSGTGVFAGYEFSGTINQTGGANGISRGLYINPTLTAAADFRALEISAGRTVLSGTELTSWGGTTSAFPALKRSGAGLVVRFADDSGDATMQSGGFISNQLSPSNSGITLKLRGGASTSGIAGISIDPLAFSTITTGSHSTLAITANSNFSPTSGTGTFNSFLISSEINQTGGASGISRGIYINPTLTAAADFRALEIANNANYALYQSGASAKNYFAGNIGIGIVPTQSLETTGSIIGGQGFSMGKGLTNTSLGFGFGRNFTTGSIFDSGRYSFQFTRPGNGDRLDLEVYDGAGTLAARNTVDSAGSTGLGTISPGSYKLRLVATRQAASGDLAVASLENAGTSSADVLTLKQTGEAGSAESQFVTFYTNAGLIGSIASNGSGVTSYNTTSDRRLKDNIEDTEYGIDDVLKIPVREYTMRQDPKALKQTGFIAQELAEIYPDAVSASGDDGISPLNGKTPWSIDYGRLTPLLVKSIQDQQLLLGDISDKEGLSTVIPETRQEASLDPMAYISEKVQAGWRPLRNLAALRLTAIRGYFEETFAKKSHQEQICVGTPDNETCLTKSQLDTLLQNRPASGGGSAPAPESEPEPDNPTPPDENSGTPPAEGEIVP